MTAPKHKFNMDLFEYENDFIKRCIDKGSENVSIVEMTELVRMAHKAWVSKSKPMYVDVDNDLYVELINEFLKAWQVKLFLDNFMDVAGYFDSEDNDD